MDGRQRKIVAVTIAVVCCVTLLTVAVSASRSAEVGGAGKGWQYAVLQGYLDDKTPNGAAWFWDPRPYNPKVEVYIPSGKDEEASSDRQWERYDKARTQLYETLGGKGEGAVAPFINLLASQGWEYVEMPQAILGMRIVFKRPLQ